MAAEDAAEKLYVSEAPSLSHHPAVANYHTVNLSGLKDMTLELANLFGLVLPVSMKKQTCEVTR